MRLEHDMKEDSPNDRRNVEIEVGEAGAHGEDNEKREADCALVYIVDDESVLSEMLCDLLVLEGYPARWFSSSEVALKEFANASPRPRLLVTDFGMKGINGMELIQRCRQLNPRLKTISCSGTGTDYFKDYQIQPDRFVPKPFTAETLLTTVRELLSGE